ncbi:uncharacterized protein UBRO_07382 [Ustilago bromivora]|uniref:Uncharacterized protein n=1 Tax=Ustilago bromivora TaxID=307758 RepID=A0A1K0HK13_9BASI|nr:uncharacterized protein UBRO_07382 [Ustilago bromivora]SYW84296.1 uncharacterized protein UBRO2_05396 [Ustilago bromivora]
MQDREFTMAKSLLTVLSGQSRSTKAAKTPSSSSSKKASNSSKSTFTQAYRSSRRHRFDDKSGPPPPRGSLTSEKLSYLDWRLKRINHVRQESEGSPLCWIDGRDTIGRTSFDVRVEQELEERTAAVTVAPAPKVPQAAPVMPSRMAPIYADEKVAGIKALEHAFAGDSVLATMPYLAKRDSSSGSEMSGSSDQQASHASGVLRATADKDVGGVYFTKPRKSFLTRAGTRFNKKKTETVGQDAAESRPASRGSRSLARMWNRQTSVA